LTLRLGTSQFAQLFTTTPGLRDAVSQSERSLSGAPKEYDPRKREPEYSNAARSCIWELILLIFHYYLSVSFHVRQLLEGAQITATADLGPNAMSYSLICKPMGPIVLCCLYGLNQQQVCVAGGNDTGTTERLIKGIGAGSQQSSASGTLNEGAFWKKKVEAVPVN